MEPKEETNRSQRTRRRTQFFYYDVKITTPKARLSIDIGETPADLKSCIRTSQPQLLAQKITKKYKAMKRVNFDSNGTIQFITPTKNFKNFVLRKSTGVDGTEIEEIPDPLFTRMIISPESVLRMHNYPEELEADENAKIQFNAKIIFNDEGSFKEEIIKQREMKSTRRRSCYVPANSVIIEEESNPQPEVKSKIRRSCYVSDNSKTVKEENELQPDVKTKRRRSCYIPTPPSEDKIEIGSQKRFSTVKNHSKVKNDRLSQWLLEIPKNQGVNAEYCNSPKINRNINSCEAEVIELSSSPETVTEMKIKRRPEAAKITDIKRAKFEVDIKRFPECLDCTPFPLYHHFALLHLFNNDQSWPNINFLKPCKNIPPYNNSLLPATKEDTLPEYIMLEHVSDEEKENILKNLPQSISCFLQQNKLVEVLKNADSSTELWTSVFAPSNSALWLGDENIREKTKSFISSWKKRVRKQAELFVSPIGKKLVKNSETDDDYVDDETISTNPLILVGPSGIGKTALITSLAVELNMNVLEIHPGDRRNSTDLKRNFEGAIKSHMVIEKSGSIASFFGTKKKEQSNDKQQNIIVIDSVDITFEEDRDFWKTVKFLADESNVPIIWTCERLPYEEIIREPELSNYECVTLTRLPSLVLAHYVKCILLVTNNLMASFADLEKYVNSFKCDLRKILLDLQIQTVDQCKRLFLATDNNSRTEAIFTDKDSTYRERQHYLTDKRSQYSYILDMLEINPRPIKAREMLVDTAIALNNRLPQTLLAKDYLPYLVEMDKTYRKANQTTRTRRRQLHYFSEVRTDKSIDANGDLIRIVRKYCLS